MFRGNNKKVIIFFSIAIAILMWFFAMEDINPMRTKEFVSIPISYYGLRDGLVVTKEGKKTVNVRVTGRRNELKNINRNDFNIDIDLSKYGEGTHDIKLYGKDNFRLNNYKVSYVPNHTEIIIEKVLNRVFDIKIQIDGKVPDGFDTERIALSNATCSVEGPETVVKKIDRIVAFVDAGSITGNDSMESELVPLDDRGRPVKGVKLSMNTVDIMIPYKATHPVKVKASITGEPAEGYELESYTVKPETINLTKTDENAEDIADISTETFDISGLKENSEKEVNLLVPEGYKYSGSQKVMVKVVIKKKSDTEDADSKDKAKDKKDSEGKQKSKKISLQLSPSNLSNKPEGFEITESSNLNIPVEVEIEGDEAVIEEMGPENLTVNADMSGANKEGPVQVTLSGSTDREDVKIKNISPESIGLNLKKSEPVKTGGELKTE